ncbi:MAG TPA: oligosaccharide flippase family protein [Elusimicrobiota bacterium]|nr:oligosaccharide flippase family protein [Elusimicrobiota bacterium]
MDKPENHNPSVKPFAEKFTVRFGATFVSNILRAGFSFISGVLVARRLGATHYGDLTFLLGSFAAVGLLLDMGTSSAFFTLISRKPQSRSFVLPYLGWTFLQWLATMVVIGVFMPASSFRLIWLGHDRHVVLLAFTTSFLTNQAWNLVSRLAEARRKTILAQTGALAQDVAHAALVAVALYGRWLTIETVLWLLIMEHVILVVWLGPRLVRMNVEAAATRSPEAWREFWKYCKPLVFYYWLCFFYNFADRWFLQRFGGAQQQGFFSISDQFSNISLLATQSVLPIFWKEIAEAQERGDEIWARKLFLSASRGLFFIGGWVSCLLIPYAQEILSRTVGATYAGAGVCLALLFLNPVFQSQGHIQGTFFYASGSTRNQVQIGIFLMVIGLPISYFLLAPAHAIVPGLHLGAIGLTLKMLVVGFIGINYQAYVIARAKGWPHHYLYNGLILVVLWSLGWLCKHATALTLAALGLGQNVLGMAALSCLLYILASGILVYRFPALSGLSREELAHLILAAWRKAGFKPLYA